jgi:hypothetical protein
MNGYVISLPEHQDERWPRIEAKLPTFGLTPHLRDGIRATEVLGQCENLGEVGCMLAHKGILEEIVSSGEGAYIFEDDARFRQGVTELPTKRFAAREMGLLGAAQNRVDDVQPRRGFYRANKFTYATFAYYMGPVMAEYVLDWIDNRRMSTAIDKVYCKKVYPNFFVPVSWPFVVIGYGSKSDIQDEKKKTDRPKISRWETDKYE